ncbi:hypothetical protein D3C71_1711970 [compost metagenome]
MEDAVHAPRCLGKAVAIAEVSHGDLRRAPQAGDRRACLVADEGADCNVALPQFRNDQACEFACRADDQNERLSASHGPLLDTGE